MNKTLKTAKIMLMVIIFSFIIPLLGSVKASALSAKDLGVEYSSNGITFGQDSAWAKNKDQTSAIQSFFVKYKAIIMAFFGVATLTLIAFAIKEALNLAKAVGNPQGRSQALTALLWLGVAIAITGGITVYVGFFSSILVS